MVQQQEEGCYKGTQAEKDTSWPTGSQLLFYFFQLVSRTPRLTSSVSLLWLHPLRPFLRLATPICCPKQEMRGAFDGSVATASPLLCLIPHRSSLLSLSFLPRLWLCHHHSLLIAGLLLFSFFFFYLFVSTRGGVGLSCRAPQTVEQRREQE